MNVQHDTEAASYCRMLRVVFEHWIVHTFSTLLMNNVQWWIWITIWQYIPNFTPIKTTGMRLYSIRNLINFTDHLSFFIKKILGCDCQLYLHYDSHWKEPHSWWLMRQIKHMNFLSNKNHLGPMICGITDNDLWDHWHNTYTLPSRRAIRSLEWTTWFC